MTTENIRTSCEGGVFTIALNRPDKLNALTREMHLALQDAFDLFAADGAALVCLVRSTSPRAFCAGSDLAGFQPDNIVPYGPSGYAGIAERWNLAKPVIAVVDGLCLGGGFELALSCDVIIASEKAVFGLPEPRVGLIAIAGGIYRLARQVGLKQAMLPLLTAANISAADGLAMGFVSKLVASAELDAATARICEQIMANAPLAVQLTKTLAHWSLDRTLEDAMSAQAEHPAFVGWTQSEDAQEGVNAFVAKRPPMWKGR